MNIETSNLLKKVAAMPVSGVISFLREQGFNEFNGANGVGFQIEKDLMIDVKSILISSDSSETITKVFVSTRNRDEDGSIINTTTKAI